MNANITITEPALMAGEHFEVRYRQLPSGSWNVFPDQMDNDFTIPDLTEGNYQVEITFVKSDGTLCDAITYNFTVPPDPVIPDCDCPTVSNVYIQRGCDRVLTLHADIDTSDLTACNYQVIYSQAGNSNTINYQTIPDELNITLNTTENVTLIIRAYCCELENWLECYNENVTDIHECECIGELTITSANSETLIGNQSKVTVIFTASNPDIPPYLIQIVSGSNVFNTSVGTDGTYDFIVPFLMEGTPTVTISNYCGDTSIDITTDIEPCDSDVTITLATRFVNGSTQFVKVAFTESGAVSPPYVIEVWDTLSNTLITSLSVNSAGTYDIEIEKIYYSRRMFVKVISPCDQDQATVIYP